MLWFYNSNMKKLFTFLFSALFSIAYAGSDNWHSEVVPGEGVNPIGFIYYTGALGTKVLNKKEKTDTALEFICSYTGDAPVMSIFWRGYLAKDDVTINTFIDNKLFNAPTKWSVDGELIYIDLVKSTELIKQLKNARTVRFQWSVGEVQETASYSVAFNMTGVDFSDFNAKCNTLL